MFLRVSKGKSRDYVVIVRGYRDQNGKPKQKTVKNLGSFRTEKEKDKLYQIGHRLIADIDGKTITAEHSSVVKELSRGNWGGPLVVSKLLKRFNLEKKVDALFSHRKIKFDISKNLEFLLINRLIEPSSKLAAYNDRELMNGYEDVELHHLYRTIDELCNAEEEIKEHIFKRQQKLAGEKIEVVLFDVTTLYFESVKQDDLRDFGYSKDCKFGEVQIMLSMMVSSDGRPLGYEIFPGNSYEGNTILKSIKALQEKYAIKKVTIVADRGMSSLGNLQAIKDAGFEFCVAFRLKSASKKLQQEVLEEQGYEICKTEKDFVLKYKKLDNKGNKLLSVYSSKRAEKDRSDREKLLNKAEIMLQTGSYKNKRGAKKFLQIKEEAAPEVLYDKAESESIYDGYYAISYSDNASSAEDILGAYHDLWKIEDSFRRMKNFLQTRPIYHWSENRIKGHISLNYIALALEKDLEISTGLSSNRIRKALRSMQCSRIKVDQHEILCHSNLTPDSELILKTLKIKPPANKVVNT